MKSNPKKNVFLVDDHPLVLEGLERFISVENDLCVAGTASSIDAAIEKICGRHIDLVITDLSLGKESGYDLIKALLTKKPGMPILALSMHEESSWAERAFLAGARGYLTKSSSTDAILEAIRLLIGGGTCVPESLLTHFLSREKQAHAAPENCLSERELEVFRLLGMGYKAKRIAIELNLSSKTVDSHCGNIKSKLKLNDSHELVQQATIWAHKIHRL